MLVLSSWPSPQPRACFVATRTESAALHSFYAQQLNSLSTSFWISTTHEYLLRCTKNSSHRQKPRWLVTRASCHPIPATICSVGCMHLNLRFCIFPSYQHQQQHSQHISSGLAHLRTTRDRPSAHTGSPAVGHGKSPADHHL